MGVFSGQPHSSESTLVGQHAPSTMRVGKASERVLRQTYMDALSGPHAPSLMRVGKASGHF